MLTSDLLMDIRAARRISADQITRLERLVFGTGTPSRDQLELLLLLDTYLQRRDAGWAELLARAAAAAVPLPLPRAA
jgi:hypothetical protein